MTVTLNPYVSLRGTAREALEFYHSVLGGTLQVMTFADYPDMAPPGEEHLVMHGQLETDDGLTLMAADVPSSMPFASPAGFAISISGDDGERLRGCWNGLSVGGTVTAPYETPPWDVTGGAFGMFTDRFGVDWMISYSVPPTIES